MPTDVPHDVPNDVPSDRADDRVHGQGRKVPALQGNCRSSGGRSVRQTAGHSYLLLASETLLFGATYTRSRDLIISDWAIAGIPSLTLPSGYCWGIKNWGEKDGSAPVRWGVATEVETNKQLARGLGCVFTHKAAKLCIIPCSSLARSVCSRRVGPGECCLYRYLYYRNKHRVVLVPLCLLCSLNCVTRSRGDVTLPITHLAVFLCSDGLQISR